ncbi:3-isopropylmalate dehydratase large subunit [Altererythrobacter sp. GH1-8]|uniref:3-isopropylmalate dehydratase large subunit n=1 Tax=Altererythrobacter sp. GH1-8 TaxID=3349333 RepID=UPI00374CF334
MNHPQTLYDKLWAGHVVKPYGDGEALIYVDRHLVQEVSSPLAFEGLKARGLPVRCVDAQFAVADHAVPTTANRLQAMTGLARKQVKRLEENCEAFGIPYAPLDGDHQGIVHIIGPELGFTLPGVTLVCGDSHTSTHGAFGALAFGIGTSECEAVLATQCLRQSKQRNMRVRLTGKVAPGVTVKDAILALIAKIGVQGGAGHAIEYCGGYVAGLSMEERMTLCNMTIEAGARIGLVAPDQVTFDYLHGRPFAPTGDMWDAALAAWRDLRSDDDAQFDREVTLDVSPLAPQVSWGTTPADCGPVSGYAPDPELESDTERREHVAKGLAYMGLEPGQPLSGLAIDKVFIGSCTNGRLSDIRKAAEIAKGRKVAAGVQAIVVPGSMQVKQAAEAEGLAAILAEAGFEWREPGCSMCVAMNTDRLQPEERCASTSNRNFEGRQGPQGRTHLMSPQMASAAAIAGRIVDVRELAGGHYAEA